MKITAFPVFSEIYTQWSL